MGGIPIGLEWERCIDIGTAAGSGHGTIFSTGSANAKTAWTQLVAATAQDTFWAIVTVFNSDAVVGWVCAFDIGIGPSGSEEVIVSNLVAPYAQNVSYSFPLSIPYGSRISARMQSDAAANNGWIQIQLLESGVPGLEGAAGIDSVGFATATTQGTVLTSGAANTKGSFAQLTAATTREYMAFNLGIDMAKTGSQSPQLCMMDLAIGASGSEQLLLSNATMYCDYNTNAWGIYTGPYFMAIPLGSRISARWL